jgi:PTS system mannose-specific IIA component
MVGVLVATHLGLGEELLKVAELIKGSLPNAAFVSIEQGKSMDEIGKELAATLKKLDSGAGVLILTDIFGGTPANMSFSFMKERKVEVVTGVNLPMLLRLYDVRTQLELRELACEIKESGKNNIYVAGQFLDKKPCA